MEMDKLLSEMEPYICNLKSLTSLNHFFFSFLRQEINKRTSTSQVRAFQEVQLIIYYFLSKSSCFYLSYETNY